MRRAVGSARVSPDRDSRLLAPARVRAAIGKSLFAEPFVARAIAAASAACAACAACDCAPSFAMLAPERDAAGHWSYTLFAEGELPRDLAARLETQLRENPHYALCRDLGQLGPLRCCRIAPGAFEIFCRAGVFAGQRLGDLKPQSLSPRTDWRRHFTTTSESS